MSEINNTFYDELEEGWYEANDHPIALLRAENKARIPWVTQNIAHYFEERQCKVADIGCGAGFLSNALAQHGHYVTGIDLSEKSLDVARKRDVTGTVFYCQGSGYALPFTEEQFDVVCAMDFLEHVEDPVKVIQQVAKVLKPNGLFFFHTFNRNWFSYLFAIKGVDWFAPNAPKNMHLYKLFIKPEELKGYLNNVNMEVKEYCGLMPKPNWGFLRFLLNRKISEDFRFTIVKSLSCGYMGYAIKLY